MLATTFGRVKHFLSNLEKALIAVLILECHDVAKIVLSYHRDRGRQMNVGHTDIMQFNVCDDRQIWLCGGGFTL